ncbi:extracellular solute-binding protein [Chitinivorax sp. B]|uniref:ABC transporter substrate-binding protein n=1 Tax=Chitinivorax sp. B TaxID=2502235 RepID=UPI0010F526C5|nr:extracellular solute-binding protein [Chitinivorax sp. B]
MTTLLPAAKLMAEPLDVLHWWTSQSERRAVDWLARQVTEDNIPWRDATVPGGGGTGAMKVLKSRVLSGQPPASAQLNGYPVMEWADLGLLLELDGTARDGQWQDNLFPAVYDTIRFRDHVVAAPLGIHRINTLLVNRKLFARLKLSPPQTWAEFESTAASIKKAGITPLLQSSEPWQVATLFESLVLAEGGTMLYRDLFAAQQPAAFQDSRFANALARLRRLKQWMPPLQEISWDEQVKRFAKNEAAMFIMGDWAKGEAMALGMEPEQDFWCVAVPGSQDAHLYSIDTLVMFSGDYSRQEMQWQLAGQITTQRLQLGYNRIKGSVPVLRNLNPSLLDSCARSSWQSFARGKLAPSLTHRMAADDRFKDAIIAQVHRFFIDDNVTAADVQRKLSAVTRFLRQDTHDPQHPRR